MPPTNDELDRAVKDLKKQVTLLKQFITPTGAIIPFAGSTAPSGWLLCDGSAIGRVEYAALFEVIKETYGIGDSSTTFNLPDLRGRTAIGTGQGTGLSDRIIGQVVGEENHALTVDEMPQHAHTGSTTGAGGHIHTGSTVGAGEHSHTGSTAKAGEHSHTGSVAISYNSIGVEGVKSGVGPTSGDIGFWVALSGEHAHDVTIGGAGDHTHDVTIDGPGDHAHGATIDEVGGGQLHNNMPPSLVLNYIIKI